MYDINRMHEKKCSFLLYFFWSYSMHPTLISEFFPHRTLKKKYIKQFCHVNFSFEMTKHLLRIQVMNEKMSGFQPFMESFHQK